MYEPATNKSLGQHWLKDRHILEQICTSAQISKGDKILEIGPGPGYLTHLLYQKAAYVTAVEFDKKLAENLTKQQVKNLKVINQDILKFNFESLPKNYKIVANIPYYLTSHLIRKVYESSNQPKLTVLLVQKEVAQRIAATNGDMSLLSVSVQLKNEVKLGVIVKAESFIPPPKVDSQVVILTKRPEPLFLNLDEKLFFKIVKAGFSEKRKKLRNSLSGGLGMSHEQVEDILKQALIDKDSRAQNLSLEQWYQIYKAYIKVL